MLELRTLISGKTNILHELNRTPLSQNQLGRAEDS